MPTVFSKKDVDSICRALVKQYNRLHEDTVASDGYVHRDQTSVISSNDFADPESVILAIDADDASDLASSLTLTNELRGKMKVHFRDGHAHRTADLESEAALDGYIDAADLDDVQDQLNLMHHTFNTHLSRVTAEGFECHVIDDTANEVTDSPATDQSSSNTLANALKDALDAHVLDGPAVGRIKLED